MAASSSISSQLARLEDGSTSQTDKANGYTALLKSIFNSSSNPADITPNLTLWIDSLLTNSNLGIVAARPLLSSAVSSIQQLSSTEAQIASSSAALDVLRSSSSTSTYEDQDTALRHILAGAYQANDEFTLAAQTLEAIPVENTSGAHRLSDADKARHWMTICRLYIEDDDMLRAESYLNKAKTLRHKIAGHEAEIELQLALSQARILDSKREFLDASLAYHAVSQSTALADEDRVASLEQAVTTAVLAPAGPQRSRLLARLFKDERSSTLQHGQWDLLSRMHLDRLVGVDEVRAMEARLAAHQLATTADGSTVLGRAMIEHNLLAASRLYANLDFESLGSLLGLDAERAEEIAARMLEQGRLAGYLDQIDGCVVFEENGRLRAWDADVGALVEDVERVASLVGAA